jgi:uncharacterized repeat protein (TIGR03803 family)
MNRKKGWQTACSLSVLVAIATIDASAQTFKSIFDFSGTNDGGPVYSALVQGTDGKLYGTTWGGGANGEGTVFRVTSGGIVDTIYSFCVQSNCEDGATPLAGLALGSDGNFYGTTVGGGANDFGTVFKITLEGTLTTLHSFDNLDGAYPWAGVIQATDGNFYGTTKEGGGGGVCEGSIDCGTVFKITPSGKLTTLYSFSCTLGDCANGVEPVDALLQASDGNFYGTTSGTGTSGFGTIFKITPDGDLTTLYVFIGNINGAQPFAPLIQGTNGNLYGTTAESGGFGGGYGSIFEITLNGVLTTLHSFDETDGAVPIAPLLQGTDGNLYGTAAYGGTGTLCSFGCGTVFRMTTEGVFTLLHSFDLTDGAGPEGGMVQYTDGNFYGVTQGGGNTVECTNGCGTIFGLVAGLGAFVKTVPTAAIVGRSVRILGTGLKGATSVTFNGLSAAFELVSGSLISTTVPTGATTGPVQVVTPSGTLTSNVNFQVLP